MTFRVGMKVICIKAPRGRGWEGFFPSVKGRIYTIREIYISPHSGVLALRFEEHINPICSYGYECGYNAERFRPIVDRKAEISFTEGAPKDSEQFDNRRKVKVRT